MQIKLDVNKNNINDTIIKSIIFKTVIELFFEKNKIDIKNSVRSIKMFGDVFLVNVEKPIIAHELYLINEEIKKVVIKKLKKMWFNFLRFEIKYK